MIDFKLVASVAAPVVLGAGTAETFSDEHVKLLAYLAGTVVAVVAVIAWIDYRINRANLIQTKFLIREIRSWQRLLAVRLGVPEIAPPDTTDELPLTE